MLLFVHGRYKGIAGRRAKRIGLQSVLIHYMVMLLVHPGLAKQTGPKLVILIVLTLVSNYWLIMVSEKFVLWLLEIPPVMGWKLET